LHKSTQQQGLSLAKNLTKKHRRHTTPIMSPWSLGEMPRPVQIPPTEGFDDVTDGYVPKSTSSR
jgi:hypothetical protein